MKVKHSAPAGIYCLLREEPWPISSKRPLQESRFTSLEIAHSPSFPDAEIPKSISPGFSLCKKHKFVADLKIFAPLYFVSTDTQMQH